MIAAKSRYLRRIEWNWPLPLRYLAISLFRTLFRLKFCHALIATLNRRFRIIEKFFVMYPGSTEYLHSIIPDSIVDTCRWSPVCCGLYWQNGSLGLIWGISSLEGAVAAPENAEQLAKMTSEVHELLASFGIEHVSYSGILPGVLASRRLRLSSTELSVTVSAVELAIQELTTHCFGSNVQVPLIVLGGKGFVGRRLLRSLGSERVYCIDRGDRDNWPMQLGRSAAILVNVASAAAMYEYLDLFWPELVVLNEAYPDPSPELCQQVKAIGCPLYHLSGLIGGAIPPFPSAYAGSIPCCAGIEHSELQVLVKML